MIAIKFKNLYKFPLIFVIILTWIFSGWPPIDINTDISFPPMVEKVQAADGDAAIYVDTDGTFDTNVTSWTGVPFNLQSKQDAIFTQNANDIDVDLGTTGKYLYGYSIESRNDTYANRISWLTRVTLAGTEELLGHGQGYRRDATDDTYFAYGYGLVDATAGDDLRVEIIREGNQNPTNHYLTASGSSFWMFKIDDTWPVLRLQAQDNQATTVATQNINFTTSIENSSSTIFGHSTSTNPNQITLLDTGHYAVIYNVGVDGATDRTSITSNIAINGTSTPQSFDYSYMRFDNTTLSGRTSNITIIEATANDILTLEWGATGAYSAFSTNTMAPNTGISIIRLPDDADYMRIHETVDGQTINNTTITAITYDTEDELDSGSFSYASSTGITTIQTSGSYLFTMGARTNRGTSGATRLTRESYWYVNDTEQPVGSTGMYVRGDQGVEDTFDGGWSSAGIFALLQDDTIDNRYEDYGSDGNGADALQPDSYGITAVRIGSLFGGLPINSQLHYRWRDDTTDINTSGGWLASEDSNVIGDITKNTTYRLRMEVANSGTGAQAAAKTYELQYAFKDQSTCDLSTIWAGVADSADAFDMVATAHITPDGEATTALLANSEAYTFVAGEGRESADTTGAIGPMAASRYTELEYSFEATNSAIDGASYCFRLYDTNNSELLDTYIYPEVLLYAEYVFRSTEYYLTTGDFTGTTYDLTLDQDLVDDYFVMVRGSQVGDGAGNTDSHYARVYEVPGGKGDLPTSGASNVIALSRYVADSDWEGVVTVVEALNVTSTKTFHLLDIIETSIVGTATTGTSTSAVSWSDINQVVPFGGYKGGGVEYEYAGGNTEHDSSATQLRLAGANSLIWERVDDVEYVQALGSVTMTTFIIEWGSEWDVQHAHVSGIAAANGAASAAAYDTASIGSVVRDNTWVWGTGTSEGGGIGDIAEGSIVTLGDGVTQLSSETEVAVGAEYSFQRETDIYVMTHPDLAVDYRFKSDANTADTDTAVIVDNATDGTRMSLVYNGCNGSGTAHPRTQFWSRYTANGEITLSRGYSGQDYPAWVQGIDYAGLIYTVPVASISMNTDGIVNFGTLALGSTEDNTATGINDVESITVDTGPADLSILTSNFSTGANTWSMGASNGANQVKWEYASTTPNWNTFLNKGSYYTFDKNVSASASRDINLRITMPTASDTLDPYSAGITILVTEP